MNDVPVICYLRATPDGNPEWSEDCVCEDPVYPSHDEDDSVSMPMVRQADHLAAMAAVIAERDQLRAEIEALRKAPEGWQLVPVEPTPAMLVAINWPNDPAGYRAMLAAAPAQPAVPVVCVPEERKTGSWESARIGDFNAGWNACRDSALTLFKEAAYMELDTTTRSIAIQDKLRVMLAAHPAHPTERQEQGEVQRLPSGWRVFFTTSSVVREGDRWEVYGPNGGGVVSTHDVKDWAVRELLDALAASTGQEVEK